MLAVVCCLLLFQLMCECVCVCTHVGGVVCEFAGAKAFCLQKMMFYVCNAWKHCGRNACLSKSTSFALKLCVYVCVLARPIQWSSVLRSTDFITFRQKVLRSLNRLVTHTYQHAQGTSPCRVIAVAAAMNWPWRDFCRLVSSRMELQHDEVLTSAPAWSVAALCLMSQRSFPTHTHNAS